MKPEAPELMKLLEVIESLRGEVGRLGERLAALEAAAPTAASQVPVQTQEPSQARLPAPAAEPAAPGISEELVLVISAAIAAYLGKRPHIRQIRLIGSAAWAQQGRVTIQASHALSVHSVRS